MKVFFSALIICCFYWNGLASSPAFDDLEGSVYLGSIEVSDASKEAGFAECGLKDERLLMNLESSYPSFEGIREAQGDLQGESNVERLFRAMLRFGVKDYMIVELENNEKYAFYVQTDTSDKPLHFSSFIQLLFSYMNMVGVLNVKTSKIQESQFCGATGEIITEDNFLIKTYEEHEKSQKRHFQNFLKQAEEKRYVSLNPSNNIFSPEALLKMKKLAFSIHDHPDYLFSSKDEAHDQEHILQANIFWFNGKWMLNEKDASTFIPGLYKGPADKNFFFAEFAQKFLPFLEEIPLSSIEGEQNGYSILFRLNVVKGPKHFTLSKHQDGPFALLVTSLLEYTGSQLGEMELYTLKAGTLQKSTESNTSPAYSPDALNTLETLKNIPGTGYIIKEIKGEDKDPVIVHSIKNTCKIYEGGIRAVAVFRVSYAHLKNTTVIIDTDKSAVWH